LNPRVLALTCVALCASPALGAGPDSVPLAPDEIRARWHDRLAGRRFTATVELRMKLGDVEEVRELIVFRDDEGSSRERVMVRFQQPVDLRNTTFLYLERPGLPSDYFMYQPATRRVRRLPQSVADQDFYGVDMEFLGFGVAQSEPTEIVECKEESVGGRRAYRLQERALRENPRFEERLTWIDAETFVPLRTEHTRRGRRQLLADTVEIGDRQGLPTPVRVRFERADRREIELRVARVDYEAAIPEEYFSVMELAKARSR
jgi:hypothetical protein